MGTVRVDGSFAGFFESHRDLVLIEHGGGRALRRVDEGVCVAGFIGGAVDEAFAWEPGGVDDALPGQGIQVVEHEFFGSRVVLRGVLAGLLSVAGSADQGKSHKDFRRKCECCLVHVRCSLCGAASMG